MSARLVEIAPPAFDVELELRYGSTDNFTGAPVYARPACYLRPEAAELLAKSIELAGALGYRLKVFDAFRPTEAQWALWNHTPDADFLAHPERGSPHSRGVAIDVTLIDATTGEEAEMGTDFDAFTPRSHHGRLDVSVEAQRNRAILLGLMTAAGWDCFLKEWWHYQMFDARARFELIADGQAAPPMMS